MGTPAHPGHSGAIRTRLQPAARVDLSGLAGVAVMPIVFAAVILGGVYYMLTQFGDELDSELDTRLPAGSAPAAP